MKPLILNAFCMVSLLLLVSICGMEAHAQVSIKNVDPSSNVQKIKPIELPNVYQKDQDLSVSIPNPYRPEKDLSAQIPNGLISSNKHTLVPPLLIQPLTNTQKALSPQTLPTLVEIKPVQPAQ